MAPRKSFLFASILCVCVALLTVGQHQAVASKAGVNKIKDPGFEGGTPNDKWKQRSTFWPQVICDGSCTNSASLARTGNWCAVFGGNEGSANASFLTQKTKFPAGGTGTLTFWLYIDHFSGNGADQLSVYVDQDRVFKVKDGNTHYDDGYTRVQIDVGAFCDGQRHLVKFRSTSSGIPSYVRFLVDDVSLAAANPKLGVP